MRSDSIINPKKTAEVINAWQ